MKTIAVFTGSRADYGLLMPLMQEIRSRPVMRLQLIVSGMHLSPEFGLTVEQIEKDGFEITAKVEMLLSSDSRVGVAKSMGVGIIGFADALDRLRPDVLVVLGDRFEALAISQVAMLLTIPIAHLHGGEITEGAFDDSIRHAITKMARLHFVSTESHRRRVLQLGEADDTVFNVGAFGLDLALHTPIPDRATFISDLGFDHDTNYFLVSYHPVTNGESEDAHALLEALDHFPEYRIVLTGANADNGGRQLNALFETWSQARHHRVTYLPSAGSERYLRLMRSAAAVIGNSSSGIIEAPSFGVPTIDVGQRQAGRTRGPSVLHTKSDTDAITSAIRTALSAEFRQICLSSPNPYGTGGAARKAADVLASWSVSGISKKFQDKELEK